MRIMPIKSKKGGLEISINTIVVLILAITMLGLGLYFIRNLFGGTVRQFEEVGSDIERQMIEQMESEPGRLIMREHRITLKRGETRRLFYGIRNEINRPENPGFPIDIRCDYVFAGASTGGQAANPGHIRFETVPNARVAPDDIRVFHAIVNVDPNAVPTTYECRIRVEPNYASQSFFVEVTR